MPVIFGLKFHLAKNYPFQLETIEATALHSILFNLRCILVKFRVLNFYSASRGHKLVFSRGLRYLHVINTFLQINYFLAYPFIMLETTPCGALQQKNVNKLYNVTMVIRISFWKLTNTKIVQYFVRYFCCIKLLTSNK